MINKDGCVMEECAGVERPPVWLMRQAGRYLPEFYQISSQYPFRQRSETASLALELTMQPYRRFQPDGVIFFSDILTPLPALGVEFDVQKGVGPIIPEPLPWDETHRLATIYEPALQFPFVKPIFEGIKQEVGNDAAALGFIGSPWTVMAYAFEGRSVRHLERTKKMLMQSPAVAHAYLSHISEQLAVYAMHQVDAGAEAVQIFDSWAHHLSESDLERLSLPYVQQIISKLHAHRPQAPVLYHANGSCGKLNAMARTLSADVVSVDWATSLRDARAVFGDEQVLQGNVDPSALLCSDDTVHEQALQCWHDTGCGKHILNTGHGVLQSTPPDAPASLVNASHAIGAPPVVGSADFAENATMSEAI